MAAFPGVGYQPLDHSFPQYQPVNQTIPQSQPLVPEYAPLNTNPDDDLRRKVTENNLIWKQKSTERSRNEKIAKIALYTFGAVGILFGAGMIGVGFVAVSLGIKGASATAGYVLMTSGLFTSLTSSLAFSTQKPKPKYSNPTVAQSISEGFKKQHLGDLEGWLKKQGYTLDDLTANGFIPQMCQLEIERRIQHFVAVQNGPRHPSDRVVLAKMETDWQTYRDKDIAPLLPLPGCS